jgi:hypothetical protein
MGAEPFHGPVRDGKGWVQLAMGVKLKRVTGRLVLLLPTGVGRSLFCEHVFRCMSRVTCSNRVTHTTYGGASCREDHIWVIIAVLMRVSYRIKPYE